MPYYESGPPANLATVRHLKCLACKKTKTKDHFSNAQLRNAGQKFDRRGTRLRSHVTSGTGEQEDGDCLCLLCGDQQKEEIECDDCGATKVRTAFSKVQAKSDTPVCMDCKGRIGHNLGSQEYRDTRFEEHDRIQISDSDSEDNGVALSDSDDDTNTTSASSAAASSTAVIEPGWVDASRTSTNTSSTGSSSRSFNPSAYGRPGGSSGWSQQGRHRALGPHENKRTGWAKIGNPNTGLRLDHP